MGVSPRRSLSQHIVIRQLSIGTQARVARKTSPSTVADARARNALALDATIVSASHRSNNFLFGVPRGDLRIKESPLIAVLDEHCGDVGSGRIDQIQGHWDLPVPIRGFVVGNNIRVDQNTIDIHERVVIGGNGEHYSFQHSSSCDGKIPSEEIICGAKRGVFDVGGVSSAERGARGVPARVVVGQSGPQFIELGGGRGSIGEIPRRTLADQKIAIEH